MSIINKILQLTRVSGSVSVNGTVYSGSSITIGSDKSGNRQVIIDGVVQQTSLVGEIAIQITGNVGAVDLTAGSVTVNGDVGSVETVSGNVSAQTIKGNAQTVSGDIKTSSLEGNAKTMSGDISVKK